MNTNKEQIENCKRIMAEMAVFPREIELVNRLIANVGTPLEMLYFMKPISTCSEDEIRNVVSFYLKHETEKEIEKGIALEKELQSVMLDVERSGDSSKYVAIILFSMLAFVWWIVI
jgi:hypothetical protein